MTTKMRRLVANAVLSELDRLDLSAQWLSEHTGIAPSALRRRLTLHADFTVTELAEIALALGVSVADLVPSAGGERGG